MVETAQNNISVMPYSMMVGQKDLKLALELAYIAPKIGGVLLTGDRGTGKSTLVRSFNAMVRRKLPITLPINATEDRVVGGWDLQKILEKNEFVRKEGVLEQAQNNILYIDEVNLLDDRIVNIILDVASTGILNVELEGQDEKNKQIDFCLVGTMNPSEGGLRPQLLDRFGLMVEVTTEGDETIRSEILRNVLTYDVLKQQAGALQKKRDEDQQIAQKLEDAQERFKAQTIDSELAGLCAKVAKDFNTEGHRADYILALASMAYAALKGRDAVAPDILRVARFALQHRQKNSNLVWNDGLEEKVKQKLALSESES